MVPVERKPTSASRISGFCPSQNINRQETFSEYRSKSQYRSCGNPNSRQQARSRNNGAGVGHGITAAVSPLEPRLLLGRHRRQASRTEIRSRTALWMFHDMGLTHQHSTTQERFEVDSANTARDFLRSHGVHQQDIETVWTAIALHTTPGTPQHMHPVVAQVTAGVEMDVMGLSYAEYSNAEREAVVHAHPRSARFKEDIIQAFYDGNKHKPETTFGNVNADVLADKDPHFSRANFCSVIRASAWRG